jgi:hypothetical protein
MELVECLLFGLDLAITLPDILDQASDPVGKCGDFSLGGLGLSFRLLHLHSHGIDLLSILLDTGR